MAKFKNDIAFVGIFIFPVLHEYMNSLSLFYINDYTLSVISNPIKIEKMAKRLTQKMKSLHVSKSEKESLKINILRIASWNVKCLTIKKTDKGSEEEKIKNIGDMAEAIKRNEFVIVPLQEVSSAAALVKLCED